MTVRITNKFFCLLLVTALINYLFFFPNIELATIRRSAIVIMIAGVSYYVPNKMLALYKYVFSFSLLLETYYYLITEKTLFWNIYQVFVTIGLVIAVLFCNKVDSSKHMNSLKISTIFIVIAKILQICLSVSLIYQLRQAYIETYVILRVFKTVFVIILETLPVLVLYISFSRAHKKEVNERGLVEYGDKEIY